MNKDRQLAEELARIRSTQVGGDHYKEMAIQPWDAMRAWLTPEEYRGYHKGVVIAYLAREQQKGGLEDLAKAYHHLSELIQYEKQRVAVKVSSFEGESPDFARIVEERLRGGVGL